MQGVAKRVCGVVHVWQGCLAREGAEVHCPVAEPSVVANDARFGDAERRRALRRQVPSQMAAAGRPQDAQAGQAMTVSLRVSFTLADSPRAQR